MEANTVLVCTAILPGLLIPFADFVSNTLEEKLAGLEAKIPILGKGITYLTSGHPL